jgi:hypothetical protein
MENDPRKKIKTWNISSKIRESGKMSMHKIDISPKCYIAKVPSVPEFS